MQLLKYAYYNSELLQKGMELVRLFYPVIVYNGPLYECYFTNELVVKEIDYVRYVANGIPENNETVVIDVVSLSKFHEYLELIMQELEIYDPTNAYNLYSRQ